MPLYSASHLIRDIHSTIADSLHSSVTLCFPSVLSNIEGDKLAGDTLSCWELVSRPFLIFCYKRLASVIHAHRHHYSTLFVWEHSQTAEKAERETHNHQLLQNVAAICSVTSVILKPVQFFCCKQVFPQAVNQSLPLTFYTLQRTTPSSQSNCLPSYCADLPALYQKMKNLPNYRTFMKRVTWKCSLGNEHNDIMTGGGGGTMVKLIPLTCSPISRTDRKGTWHFNLEKQSEFHYTYT